MCVFVCGCICTYVHLSDVFWAFHDKCICLPAQNKRNRREKKIEKKPKVQLMKAVSFHIVLWDFIVTSMGYMNVCAACGPDAHMHYLEIFPADILGCVSGPQATLQTCSHIFHDTNPVSLWTTKDLLSFSLVWLPLSTPIHHGAPIC